MHKLSGIILILILTTIPLSKADPERRESIVTLSSAEQVFGEAVFVKAVAVQSFNDTQQFYLLRGDGRVAVYDSEHKLKRTFSTFMRSPIAIAVDSKGRIYVADTVDGRVSIFSSEGKRVNSFSAHRPHSIAILKNGNIVVSSPLNGYLLHVYDSSGHELKRFGNIKQFDTSSEAQNSFLNKGKVIVDLDDAIYYVFEFAYRPTIQKFSHKGKLLSEFVVMGEAIDLQGEPAAEFLTKRSPSSIGGIRIINSAAVDPITNHLWIGMNGSSQSGIVYEYTTNGEKLTEYSFVVDRKEGASRFITAPMHIMTRSPSIHVFTRTVAYRFDIRSTIVRGITPMTSPPCPAEEGWDACKSLCGTPGEPNDDKDCKAALQASISLTNQRIIASECDRDGARCTASVDLCNTQTNQVTTHSTTLECSSSGGDGGDGGDGGFGGGDCCSDFIIPECSGGTRWNCDLCECLNPSPIVIDIQGNGFNLTDAYGGVLFDIDSDGDRDKLSWTSPGSDDAWLALDRNGNGQIDNGHELFGNYTPQPPSPEPNGFLALAEYDKPTRGGNNDGRIDNGDSIFPSLRLWQDNNQNGISEAGELYTLPQLGLARLELDYRESRRRDGHGNWFRYRAKVRDAQGAHLGRWAWDVFLVSPPLQ